MYNPTSLPDEEFQRIVADALNVHQSEIDAVHTIFQNNKTAVIQIIATGRFDLGSLRTIADALLTYLEDRTIWTAYIEPALNAAATKAESKARTPYTNGVSGTSRPHQGEAAHSQQQMGFHPHAHKE